MSAAAALAVAETDPHDALLGVHANIPEEQYHASPGVSVSRLKRFAQAAAKAHVAQSETTALRFGTLIHAVLLEPNTVEARYWVTDLDRLDPRSANYKAEVERANGLELVKRADFESALRLRDAVLAQPIARDILAPGALVEQSFYWRDDETGLLCRGRTDLVRPEWRALVDIKSTQDASSRSFARTVAEYKYDWQSIYYQDGWSLAADWKPDLLLFLPIEKEPPYLCAAYEIDPDDLAEARQQLRQQLDAYAHCEASGQWPGYPDGISRISLPGWAKTQRDKGQQT
jgi:hypothetical protein